MKIPEIKSLVEQCSLVQLKQAEADLLAEKPLQLSIAGEDEGEKLTHILGAIFIREAMEQQQLQFKEALRLYTQKVRQSMG